MSDTVRADCSHRGAHEEEAPDVLGMVSQLLGTRIASQR